MKMCEDHSQHPGSVPYLSHQQVIEFQWSLWALPSALQHIFEILASCLEFVRGSLTGHIFSFFAVDSSNLKDILRRLPNSHVGGAPFGSVPSGFPSNQTGFQATKSRRTHLDVGFCARKHATLGEKQTTVAWQNRATPFFTLLSL